MAAAVPASFFAAVPEPVSPFILAAAAGEGMPTGAASPFDSL